MKDYFIHLFNYDKYANHLILDTLLKSPHTDRAVQIMAHLLAAQQRWLYRCKGLHIEADDVDLQPKNWPADTLGTIIDSNYTLWMEHLASLTDEDLQGTISYQTSNGMPFTNTLVQILTHIINHGTHHRAQVGQHLKFAGVAALPGTDYIMFTR
ncbi:hypothetical protein GCM10023149_40630 [Mucilaginibacter gynuensis]|uniref:Damage-inducible protein DinB n=1 Tax=Mucilaginibacter gynuensis TaxID=1302236 RepID=A0ABP8H3G4_9SPHI